VIVGGSERPDTAAVPDSKPFRLGRRPALDGLRAIAILAVIGFHYGPTKVAGGYLGVDVFFVLSGFLITALLVQERSNTGRISLKAFYMRRAKRLLPALFVMLAAVTVYAAMFPHRPETQHVWRDIIAAVFYVANWVHGFSHHLEVGLLDHTWSLSVEEQFYLLWPAVLVLMVRKGFSRKTIAIVVGTGVLASLIDTQLLYRHGSFAPRLAYGLDTRGVGLLMGCLLGLAVGWQVIPDRIRRYAPYTPWLGFLMLAVLFLSHRYALFAGQSYRQFVEAPPLVDIATVLIIFGVIYRERSAAARLMSIPLAVWLGRVSYGVYLWHFPIGTVVASHHLTMGLGDPGSQLLKVVLTLIVVTLSFYLVEQPILGGYWPPRFPGRRRPGVDHTPAAAEVRS